MKPKIASQKYEVLPIGDLKPTPGNPRKSNMHVLKESVSANGFYGSVLVQKSSLRIIAGEHRWRAAKAEGLTEIPCTVIDCDDETAKRLLLVDNRSADLGDHDERKLEALLEELKTTREGLLGTGFGKQNLRTEGERTENPVTVKSWNVAALRLNALFSFSAPIDLQHKIRAVLREHFPGVDFLEHVTRFDGES